jgi:hypothetical protein
VVQVSGGALARTSSVAPSIKIKSNLCGEIGSTQFLEQGFAPCSFFLLEQGFAPCSFFEILFKILAQDVWNDRLTQLNRGAAHDGTGQSDPAQL